MVHSKYYRDSAECKMRSGLTRSQAVILHALVSKILSIPVLLENEDDGCFRIANPSDGPVGQYEQRRLHNTMRPRAL